MPLRAYQQESIARTYARLVEDGDCRPCVVLPTGGGKSWLIAQIAKDVAEAGKRCLCLAHVKELLLQNAEKIGQMTGANPGVYSAGLDRRDVEQSVIVAGIQSVYKRIDELGAFAVCLVDEAHLISPDAETMYRRALVDLWRRSPQMRLVGFTATPFRLDCGLVAGHAKLFSEISSNVTVARLVDEGYLAPLTTKPTTGAADGLGGVKIRGGEFAIGELDSLYSETPIVLAAVRDVLRQSADRKSILWFCCGRKHAAVVTALLRDMGASVRLLHGETPPDARAEAIAAFRRRGCRHLVNVQVLTTGFDSPAIDCVVLLRPTMSAGLFAQMVGRGLRIAKGKQDCLILDYGGNIERHGAVDAISVIPQGGGGGRSDRAEETAQECGRCHQISMRQDSAYCRHCGNYLGTQSHETTSSTADIGGEELSTFAVANVSYREWQKRGDDGLPRRSTLRVTYSCGSDNFSEWICFEHGGYARTKAVCWWQERSGEEAPKKAAEAAEIGNAGELREPAEIKVRPSTSAAGYFDVVGYFYADESNDDIPF